MLSEYYIFRFRSVLRANQVFDRRQSNPFGGEVDPGAWDLNLLERSRKVIRETEVLVLISCTN